MKSFTGGVDQSYIAKPWVAGSIPASTSGAVAQWQSNGKNFGRLFPGRNLLSDEFAGGEDSGYFALRAGDAGSNPAVSGRLLTWLSGKAPYLGRWFPGI